MSNEKLNVQNMFQKISNSFEKASKRGGGGAYKDIMRFEKGKDYVVRLLPYRDDLDSTIYHLQYRGWKSKSTAKYVEFVDPPSDEVNPIQIYSSKLTDKLRPLRLDKDDPRMKRARELWGKDAWLLNCYIVSDPTNPDNEGQVKILRLGKKLYDIVHEHVEGERKDEYGYKCFDPSASGCSFKIRVVDNGAGYANYDKSYFMQPSEIEGLSDNDSKIDEVFSSCFELKTLFPVKSQEELEDAIEVHFEGSEEEPAPSSFGDIDDILDDKDGGSEDDVKGDVKDDGGDDEVEDKPVSKPKSAPVNKTEDDEMDALLADL